MTWPELIALLWLSVLSLAVVKLASDSLRLTDIVERLADTIHSLWRKP